MIKRRKPLEVAFHLNLVIRDKNREELLIFHLNLVIGDKTTEELLISLYLTLHIQPINDLLISGSDAMLYTIRSHPCLTCACSSAYIDVHVAAHCPLKI